MVANKFVLRFSSALVEQPIIYNLVKDYDLIINVLKADINPHKEGYVVLELSGDSENYNGDLTKTLTLHPQSHRVYRQGSPPLLGYLSS